MGKKWHTNKTNNSKDRERNVGDRKWTIDNRRLKV